MCWQPSRTYSWHVVGCYAVRDRRIGVPIEGKNRPTWASSGSRQGEIRPIRPQIRHKLFIPSKLQFWPFFRVSLPRGSLAPTLSYASLTNVRFMAEPGRALVWNHHAKSKSKRQLFQRLAKVFCEAVGADRPNRAVRSGLQQEHCSVHADRHSRLDY